MKRRPIAEEECEQALTMEELERVIQEAGNNKELERVIQEAGNNKESGDDDIPYELIKHLGKKAKPLLGWTLDYLTNG